MQFVRMVLFAVSEANPQIKLALGSKSKEVTALMQWVKKCREDLP